jgi:hypothetical protein
MTRSGCLPGDNICLTLLPRKDHNSRPRSPLSLIVENVIYYRVIINCSKLPRNFGNVLDRLAPRKPRPLGRRQGELYKNVYLPYRAAKHCRQTEPPPFKAGSFTFHLLKMGDPLFFLVSSFEIEYRTTSMDYFKTVKLKGII